MSFRRGDHVCAIYSTTVELVRVVATFLAEGLDRGERCWYVASASETPLIRAELRKRKIEVDSEVRRGALRFVEAKDAYTVHGDFDPEGTIAVFNDAIEEALSDGFSGFRAAAEMSWAIDAGVDRVIAYEALLKTMFATCDVVGLCLYDRARMPLPIINGALVTHPIVAVLDLCQANPFYDPAAHTAAPVTASELQHKLARLTPRRRRRKAP